MKKILLSIALFTISSFIIAQIVEIVSGPYLQTLGKNEVTIVRTTNVDAYVVNDIHGLNDNLKEMFKDVSFENTDLVIFNGNMVDHLQNETSFFGDFMDTSIEMFASEVPVFYARDNHETRGAFSNHFPEYLPPNNNKTYNTFKQGPVFFIVLDSGEVKPDSDIEYFGLSYFDQYRSEQQKWLEKVVESDEFKSSPFRVVILHIPPRGSWHGGIDLRHKFSPVFNNNSINVLFS